MSKAFRGDAKLTETPNGDVTDTSIDKSDVESATDTTKTDSKSVTDKVLDAETSSNKKDQDKEKAETEITATGSSSGKKSAVTSGEGSTSADNSFSDSTKACPALDDQVKDWNSQLVKENKNLHRLNTSLHERNHFLSLKQAEFEELINAEQTKNEELQNKLDDLEYELTKSRMRNGKLETVLVDTQVNI